MKTVNGKARQSMSRDTRAAFRALRRAARKVRAENRRLGLPLIVRENGRPLDIPA